MKKYFKSFIRVFSARRAEKGWLSELKSEHILSIYDKRGAGAVLVTGQDILKLVEAKENL